MRVCERPQCGLEAWELARIRVNLLKQAPPGDQALAAEGKRDVLAPLKKVLEPVLSPVPGLRRASQMPASPHGAPAPAGGQGTAAH